MPFLYISMLDDGSLLFAEYNSVRLIFTILIALFFGTAFWQMGLRRCIH